MLDSERKYVELIYGACKKYGSWDPEIVIKAGDFGRITKGRIGLAFWRRKGVFMKEGNIFEDGIADKHKIPKPKDFNQDTAGGDTWIVSQNAEQIDISVAAGSETPILTSCKVKNAFKFSAGSGALLAMENDAISIIDPPGSLRRLLEERDMLGLVIVSEVHSCSSYARILTSHKGGNVAVGLSVEPTVPVASATADVHWVRNNNTGNFKTNRNKERQRVFYPLFRLVSIKETTPTSGLRGRGESPLPDAEPPWTEEANSSTLRSRLKAMGQQLLH